ncbi:MAG TPA: flavodoxin family protein [Desulfobacteraceae bacterium]|nr:flavodoxin family protein [Desulfobacteraceae bacterium]
MESISSYVQTHNERDWLSNRWKGPRKVLGIQGSPRGKRGVTEQVFHALIEGMETSGAKVTTMRLEEMDIQGCRGCFQCWIGDDPKCPIRDDLSQLLYEIPSFDLMVWAFPLYVDGMPGLFKNILDRMMVLNLPEIINVRGQWVHPCRYERMPDLVVASVCGFYGTENFEPLIRHVEALAFNQHTPLVACLLRPDTLSLMHASGREAMQSVLGAFRNAGKQIIETGAVEQHVLEDISRPLLDRDTYIELGKGWWKKSG